MSGQAVVTIKDRQWSVVVANTYAELTSGLSGVSGIPPQTGVLFDLGYDQQYIEIDMSRMLFPLDIVFINSTQGVIGVIHNAQPGERDVRLENETLPGARCFLEANAGEAEGIEVGNNVDIQGYAQPTTEPTTGIDINSIMNVMLIMMAMGMMIKMMGSVMGPPKGIGSTPSTGYTTIKAPPTRKELIEQFRRSEWGKTTTEQELLEKKTTLENTGREIAQKAGVEFIRLSEDWPAKYATPRYWFRDSRGREIIASDLNELKWKLSGLLPQTKRYEFFPEEVRKLLPPIGSTGEDRDPMVWVKFFTPWANWTWYGIEFDGKDIFFGWVVGLEKEFGSFSLSELQSLRGPSGLKVERDIYFEPQRISQVMKLHGEYLATAVIPTQQGKYVKIIAPGRTSLTIGSIVTREELERENKKARERGEYPATAEVWEGGKPVMIRPKVIPAEKAKAQPDKLEYLADSPEFLTQTIEATGYRSKLDNAFQEAIARSKGLR